MPLGKALGWTSSPFSCVLLMRAEHCKTRPLSGVNNYMNMTEDIAKKHGTICKAQKKL